MNRPDLISKAREQGLLTSEAEQMIELLLEYFMQKHESKKKRRRRKPAASTGE
jgi:hypothetical protein